MAEEGSEIKSAHAVNKELNIAEAKWVRAGVDVGAVGVGGVRGSLVFGYLG